MSERPQLEDVDTGVSVWVVAAVVLAALALLALPLWWLLDSYVIAEVTEPVAQPTTLPTPSTSQPSPTTQGLATPVNLALGQPVTGTGPGSDPAGWAVDNNPDTSWNSGGYPPQLVEIDLEKPSTVHSIRLLVGQFPDGDTEHVVFGFRPGDSEPEVLHVFEGYTTDRQWLTYTPETPWEGLDRIGVGTLVSPSWVAWFEIQVVGTVP